MSAASNRQIGVLTLLLTLLGFGVILYKHYALGFPLLTSETEELWQVEARIDFEANGGPATVSLNLPDTEETHRAVFRSTVAPGYDYEVIDDAKGNKAVWHRAEAPPGPETLYLHSEVFVTGEVPEYRTPPPLQPTKQMDAAERQALAALGNRLAKQSLPPRLLVTEVLRQLHNPADAMWRGLERERKSTRGRLQLAVDILAGQSVPARRIRGVLLEDRQRNRPAEWLLGVYFDGGWHLFDPGEAAEIPRESFLPLQIGDEPLFEVFGGRDSQLRFSVVKQRRAAYLNAVEDARNHRSWLIDFSIFSLPVEQQSTFKLLLLIPLGALVVVILRNLVGLRTSGTFMPILIALAFLQTTLLTGLLLFLIVVSVGLILRGYLSSLNLLLVPRIAAVLVFVIILYAAIGIASHKLGLPWGLKVTFFPMVILAWTIERMSLLWDEDGPREVFIQGSGSLFTACLAYLVMRQQGVADFIFLYPEALLIVLAIIVAIGSYSGYRLSDLRRFQSMERY